MFQFVRILLPWTRWAGYLQNCDTNTNTQMQAHSFYQNVSICENATALDRMGRVFARPGSECSVSANVSLGLNRFYHECNDQETGADMAFFFKRIFF